MTRHPDIRGHRSTAGTRRTGAAPVIRRPRAVQSVGRFQDRQPPPKRMTPEQAATLAAVPIAGARAVDIARASGRTTGATRASLVALALKGLVAQHGHLWAREIEQ